MTKEEKSFILYCISCLDVNSVNNLEGKIGEFIIVCFDVYVEITSSGVTPLDEDDDPRNPERPISKRSRFYLFCKKELSVDFANYFMNHVVGLAPLWTKLMSSALQISRKLKQLLRNISESLSTCT